MEAIGLADIPQRGDVRVGQRRRGARVLEQLRQPRRLRGNGRRHQFERHGAADLGVAGAIDLADATFTEPLEQVVVGDGLRWRHRQASPCPGVRAASRRG
jgi:hypothetical protein